MRSLIILPVTILLVVLAGCASTNVAESPAQRIFALQAEFNIALEAADAYTSQPACSETVQVGCHDPEVKERIREISEEAHQALQVAKASLGSGQQNNYISLAGNAITAFVQYLAEKGVGQ